MASVNREREEALIRKAKDLRTAWILEREENRAKQLAANAEVRKVWGESDSIWVGQDELADSRCRQASPVKNPT